MDVNAGQTALSAAQSAARDTLVKKGFVRIVKKKRRGSYEAVPVKECVCVCVRFGECFRAFVS